MYLYIRTLTIHRTVVILHPLQPVYDLSMTVLRDLFAKTLERALPDEELRSPLQLPDLAEGDGTGAVAMRFLERKRAVSEQR